MTATYADRLPDVGGGSSQPPPRISVKDPIYGAVGDGVTDDSDAFTAALAAVASVYVPEGRYLLGSKLVRTLADAFDTCNIVGAGRDAVVLYWPNADGGIQINLTDESQSVQVSGLTFTTGQAAGGKGLEITQAAPLNAFAQSELRDLAFRGDDNSGGLGADYWTRGISNTGVCGVNYTNISVWGTGTFATAVGIGIYIEGVAALTTLGYAILHQLSRCQLHSLEYAVQVSDWVQTVTCSHISALNNKYGISYVGADLTVLGSTMVASSASIQQTGASLCPRIIGNYIECKAAGRGIDLDGAVQYLIAANTILGVDGSNSDSGINLVDSDYGAIVGNYLKKFDVAIRLDATSDNATLKANRYESNSANLSDSGAGNISDSTFDAPFGLKGSDTTGIDLTAMSALVDFLLLPNNVQMKIKDLGGTLRDVLGVSDSDVMTLGNAAFNTFLQTAFLGPISDGGTVLGGTSNRYSTIYGQTLDVSNPVGVAGGGTGQATAAEAIGELIQALTEDTAPVPSTDMLGSYDADADTGKKITLQRAATLARGLPGHYAGRYISGELFNPGTTDTIAVAADTLYAMPFYVADKRTWTRIGMEVTSGAAGAARLGIFTCGTDGAPGTLILDAGTVDTTSPAVLEATISQALEVGYYYLVAVFNATPTVRGTAAGAAALASIGVNAPGTVDGQVSKSFTYAALSGASPFGTPTFTAAATPLVWLREV